MSPRFWITCIILLSFVSLFTFSLSTTSRPPPPSDSSPSNSIARYTIDTQPRAPVNGTLLISTLDGKLHAVDVRTGRKLWVFGGSGRPLLSSSAPRPHPDSVDLSLQTARDLEPDHDVLGHSHLHSFRPASSSSASSTTTATATATDSDPDDADGDTDVYREHAMTETTPTAPFMIPGIDGSLFYSSPEGLKRSPIGVAECVSLSPFRTADDTRYVGHKETHTFLLNKHTGQVYRAFTPQQEHDLAAQQSCPLPPQEDLIWLGKTEFVVHAFDGKTGRQRWNVSYGSYGSFFATPDGTRTDVDMEGLPKIGVSVDGTVYSIDETKHRLKWSLSLPSAVAAIHLIKSDPTSPSSQYNDLIPLPIVYFEQHDTPDDMIISSESDADAVVDRYRAGEQDLYSKTYIGQTESGAFYALPNKVSTSSLRITDGKNTDRKSVVPLSTCRPGSASYPACLVGTHVVQQLPLVPIPVLPSPHPRQPSDQKNSAMTTVYPTPSPSPPSPWIPVVQQVISLLMPAVIALAVSMLFYRHTQHQREERRRKKKIKTKTKEKNKKEEEEEEEEQDQEEENQEEQAQDEQQTQTRERKPSNAKRTTRTPKKIHVEEVEEKRAADVDMETTLDADKEDDMSVQLASARARRKRAKRKQQKQQQQQQLYDVDDADEPETNTDEKKTDESLPLKEEKTSSETSSPNQCTNNSNNALTTDATAAVTITSPTTITVTPATAPALSSAPSSSTSSDSPSSSRDVPSHGSNSSSSSSPIPMPTSFTARTPDGGYVIGKMEILPGKPLGTGSMGTIVYSGRFEGRTVAIKRLVKPFFGVDHADKEISLLIATDQHPNVLRYYAKEEDQDFIYIALERCAGSLSDLIDTVTADLPKIDHHAVLHHMMTGLTHLHKLNIVHRDLKPANILLSRDHVGKIADMGLGKQLDLQRSSFDSLVSGSVGWQPPETLKPKEGTVGIRLTKAVDIFSAGCVVHYVLTKGKHPFGQCVERELNILQGRPCLDALDNMPEARDLVMAMIQPDPLCRLTAEDAASHPLFWSDEWKLSFLQDISDRVESESEDGPFRLTIERNARDIVGTAWDKVLDKGLLDNLGKYRKYDFASARDLLRVIRNKRHHYRDLPPDVQAKLGPVPSGFLHYFTSRFPRLLMYTYQCMSCFVIESYPTHHQPHPDAKPKQTQPIPLHVPIDDTEPLLQQLHLMKYSQLSTQPLHMYHVNLNPTFRKYYEHCSLKRLGQLQQYVRLRYQRWYPPAQLWARCEEHQLPTKGVTIVEDTITNSPSMPIMGMPQPANSNHTSNNNNNHNNNNNNNSSNTPNKNKLHNSPSAPVMNPAAAAFVPQGNALLPTPMSFSTANRAFSQSQSPSPSLNMTYSASPSPSPSPSPFPSPSPAAAYYQYTVPFSPPPGFTATNTSATATVPVSTFSSSVSPSPSHTHVYAGATGTGTGTGASMNPPPGFGRQVQTPLSPARAATNTNTATAATVFPSASASISASTTSSSISTNTPFMNSQQRS